MALTTKNASKTKASAKEESAAPTAPYKGPSLRRMQRRAGIKRSTKGLTALGGAYAAMLIEELVKTSYVIAKVQRPKRSTLSAEHVRAAISMKVGSLPYVRAVFE